MIQIDICVATVRRPTMLLTALNSLAKLRIPDGVVVRVVVIDNDANQSAAETVADFGTAAPFPTVYVCEPEKGIASARNTALAQCHGDFVAFFDDDQVADLDWLVHLYRTAITFSADVVFGPVLSVLPSSAPDWLRNGDFFERTRSKTGTPRPHGGTGSVLIRKTVIDRAGRGFDRTFGLSGGSDTEYFVYLGTQGAVMVWCDEALAWEDVPPLRANLRWLLRRNYRGGIVYARIFVPKLSLPARVVWFGLRLVGIIVGFLAFLGTVPFSRVRAFRAVMLLARNFGQLNYLFDRSFDEYSRHHRS